MTSSKFFLIFPLLYIFFFPTFIFGELAIGQGVLFLTFPLILLLMSFMVGSLRTKVDPFFCVLLGVAFVLLITGLSKVQFIDFKLLLGHIRFVFYSIVFYLSYSLFYQLDLSIRAVKYSLATAYLLAFIFVLIQIFFDNYFISLYTEKAAFDLTGFRIGGVFIWSYASAFISIPFVVMAAGDFFYKRKMFRGYYFIGFVTFIVCLLSQSKSAYLSIAIILFVFFLYCFFTFKFPKRFVFFTSVFLLIGSVFVANNLDSFVHIVNFLDALQNSRADGSTSTRLTQLKVALTIFNFDFIEMMFGYPTSELVIENAYGHYLYRHGILGASCFLAFLCFIIFYSFSCLRISLRYSYNCSSIMLFWFVLSVNCAIFSLGSSPLDGNKISYLYYCYSALALALFRKEQALYKTPIIK